MLPLQDNYAQTSHCGFYSPQIYINEAKKDGATIHNPCVNMSYWTTTIYGIDIYLGFDLVKDLEVRTVKQVLEERQMNGKYKSLEDFIMRTRVSDTQIAILIRIGAFSFTETVKTNLQWESLYICSEIKDRSLPVGLFDEAVKVPPIPKFEYSLAEHLYDEIKYFKFPITAT